MTWTIWVCPDCGATNMHAETCGAFPGEPVVHGNRFEVVRAGAREEVEAVPLVRELQQFLPTEKPEQGPLPDWIVDIRKRSEAFINRSGADDPTERDALESVLADLRLVSTNCPREVTRAIRTAELALGIEQPKET